MDLETLVVGGVGGVIGGAIATGNIENKIGAKIDTVNRNVNSLKDAICEANDSIDELKSEIGETKKTVVNAVDTALKRNINDHLIQRLFQMFSLYGKQDEVGNTVIEEISGCKYTYYPRTDTIICSANDCEIIVYLSDASLAKRYVMKDFEALLFKDNSCKITIKDAKDNRTIVTNDRTLYSFEREYDGVKYNFEYCQDKVLSEYKVRRSDSVIYSKRTYTDKHVENFHHKRDYTSRISSNYTSKISDLKTLPGIEDFLKCLFNDDFDLDYFLENYSETNLYKAKSVLQQNGYKLIPDNFNEHIQEARKYPSILEYLDSVYGDRPFSHCPTYYDEEHGLKFFEVVKPFKYHANFKYVNSTHAGRYAYCDWCLKEKDKKIHSLIYRDNKKLEELKPKGLFGFLKKRKYYKALLYHRKRVQILRLEKITLLNNLHMADVCNEDMSNSNKYAAYVQKTKAIVDTLQTNIPSYVLDDTKWRNWRNDYFENFKKNFASTIAYEFVDELQGKISVTTTNQDDNMNRAPVSHNVDWNIQRFANTGLECV